MDQTIAHGAEVALIRFRTACTVGGVRMATIGADGPTGTFQDRNGPMPW
jgi:hypothetical protein